MSDSQVLLESIYRNTQMGVETIASIKDIEPDTDILEALKSQSAEYAEINAQAANMLKERGIKEKDVNPMAKAGAEFNIAFKTLFDKTSGKIAEMMAKGNANGIIAVTRNIKRFKDASPEILALANKLLSTERNNFEQMLKFL